jgi:hypothetical protein
MVVVVVMCSRKRKGGKIERKKWEEKYIRGVSVVGSLTSFTFEPCLYFVSPTISHGFVLGFATAGVRICLEAKLHVTSFNNQGPHSLLLLHYSLLFLSDSAPSLFISKL